MLALSPRLRDALPPAGQRAGERNIHFIHRFYRAYLIRSALRTELGLTDYRILMRLDLERSRAQRTAGTPHSGLRAGARRGRPRRHSMNRKEFLWTTSHA